MKKKKIINQILLAKDVEQDFVSKTKIRLSFNIPI